MNKNLKPFLLSFSVLLLMQSENFAQITLKNDYANYSSATIGTYKGINYREAGFSGLYAIPNTNGKEFWVISDRGVNIDCANANLPSCRPGYDKMYAFPTYVPKIHRIRVAGNAIQILQTISMKRPNGTPATGLLNPDGFGSLTTESNPTDTVQDCANLVLKTTPKDVWGIDSEGLIVDKDGNFWISEEGGPTIWKLSKSGVVMKRYTPYANLPGAQPEDVQIDSVFKYRKNNRGFEGLSITPNGKIYAIIQSPLLFPSKSVGEATQVHRILEIDPQTNATRVIVYLNEGVIGASGANQIRFQDWKIGEMAAISDSTFLVLEAALRGTSDSKKIYKININNATAVTADLYSSKTAEGLVNASNLAANGIIPVKKTLFLDLLANGWPAVLDKAEGLAIINDSTIAVCNDNDYGQECPAANGLATATGKLSHLFVFGLQGSNKINNLKRADGTMSEGLTGPSSSQSPYILPAIPDAKFTSILTAGDTVNGYRMAGIPDGLGAFDNGNGTFTLLMNHEMGNTVGGIRAHGSKGAFVSKWLINKSDLSVVSGSDLMQNVNLWNGTGYTTYNSSTPTALTAFNRFCSADLPAVSAFYNNATGKGTQERIFMNGEEGGAESRAMAHIVTGPNGGTSYELPRLGKGAWENSLAHPATGDITLVAMPNDGAITDSKLYFYIGTKTNTGTEVEKAGLTNGKLLAVQVAGYPAERTSSTVANTPPAAGTRFSLLDLGNVENTTGTALNTAANTAGATKFARPEDGVWDPKNPNDFYFNTTDQLDQVNDGIGTQAGRSKVWRLRFDDISNPELGGTVEAVLDGTEGHTMLDNMTIDNFGHLILVEDVGNAVHNGKVWEYTIATDQLKKIGQHDQARFGDVGLPAAAPYNQDEEASGIIDVSEILGAGMFLLVDQAHYAQPGEIVEGGQILSFYNPDTYNSAKLTTGPSSSQSPYVIPVASGVKTTAILTAGDTVNGYRMAGIPDGLGAFDNGNGTFTLLMNHEMGNTVGGVRAHGSKGSFVSKWLINKSDLSVISGSDLMQNVNLWNGTGYTTYNSSTPTALTAFNRFCSADLPAVSAFYNNATGKGTQERIFMNGEEGGAESRAMAHIVTGPNGGTSYELPRLGKGAWENSLAHPATGDITLVAMPNDGAITDSKLYFYIGTKTNTGTEVEKAGLTNGKLLAVQVAGYPAERTSSTVANTPPAAGTRFSLLDLGNVENTTGTALNTAANAAGATKFARPEDGVWDPKNPNDFYFNTTDQLDQVNDGIGTQVGRSKVWRIRFDDISNPESGGTVEAVLDGTEGQVMLDNMTIDNFGHLLLVEDVGNAVHNGKVWEYTIATDQLKLIGQHDQARFGNVGVPATAPYNQDEEASGIIDASEILGAGMFLLVDQAHYAQPGEIVEGGQILALYNPESALHKPTVSNINRTTNEDVAVALTASEFKAVFKDADGDQLSKVKISTLPVSGTLKVNGSPVTAGQEIVAADLNSLIFTPNVNFFGNDSIGYNAADALNYSSNGALIKLQILPVNDAPVVSNFAKTVTEDSTIIFLASDFLDAYSDVEGKPLDKITIVSVPSLGKLKLNNVNIYAGQVIGRSKLSGITFVTDPNAFGSSSFTWKAFDFTSYSQNATVSITVVAVNDVPVASNFSKNVNEDQTLNFTAFDFEHAYTDVEGKPLNKITVVTLPSSGKLKLNNVDVFAGQRIGASQLGLLSYVPEANVFGSASFEWKASDFVNYSQNAVVTINIVSVNDAPSVSLTGPPNGSTFAALSTIPFSATASDIDGTVKVQFYAGSTLIGEDLTEPFSFDWNAVEGGNYILTAKAVDNEGGEAISNAISVTVGCTANGGITRYVYSNVYGTNVSDLTSSPKYPNEWFKRTTLGSFEILVNQANHFGTRIIGYICAPQTGNYTFYISGDDKAELWLSSDTSQANKVKIATVPNLTGFREYTKYPAQTSSQVWLVKGAVYWVQALHKESIENDHLSVAWKMPDNTVQSPISGVYLSTYESSQLREEESADELSGSVSEITVSPVPAVDLVNVDFASNGGGTTISVTDAFANEVIRTSINAVAGSNRVQLSVQNLASGVYFVNVVSQEKRSVHKIIVAGK